MDKYMNVTYMYKEDAHFLLPTTFAKEPKLA